MKILVVLRDDDKSYSAHCRAIWLAQALDAELMTEYEVFNDQAAIGYDATIYYGYHPNCASQLANASKFLI